MIITYVALRKHTGRWAPETDGIDASTDHYKEMIAAGWLPKSAWTVEKADDGKTLGLDKALMPIRNDYPSKYGR